MGKVDVNNKKHIRAIKNEAFIRRFIITPFKEIHPYKNNSPMAT
jgi:hypothetical protein